MPLRNEKKHLGLKLQSTPNCFIQSEEGSCIKAYVSWDRAMRPGDTFIVTKGLDGCIYIFTEPDYDRFMEMLQAMPNKNPNKAIYGRFFLANASKVEITPDYIIPMPQFLIDFARISTEAVIEGKGDFARLWNISEWEAFHFVGFEDVLRRLKIYRMEC